MRTLRFARTGAARIFLLAAALTGAANATTIFNNTFATPTQSTDGYTYNPTGASWTFLGDSGIASQGSPWFSVAPPVGNQAAFLQALGSPSGDDFYQLLTGFNIGDTYQFTFYAADRPGYTVDDFQVLLGSTVIDADVSPSSTSFTQFSTSTIAATASSMQLTFQAVNTADAGDADVIIALVQVTDLTAIPEVSTAGLLGSGLALLWFRRRRRS